MNESTAASGDDRLDDAPLLRPVVAGPERLPPTGDPFPELAPPLRVPARGARPEHHRAGAEPDASTPAPISASAPQPPEQPEPLVPLEPGGSAEPETPLEDLPWLTSYSGIRADTGGETDEADREYAAAAEADYALEADEELWEYGEEGGFEPALDGLAELELPDLPAIEPVVSATRSTPVDDRARAEELATRLERIARSLRERGPAGTLADADPLGVLIAGYLLGSAELQRPRGADSP